MMKAMIAAYALCAVGLSAAVGGIQGSVMDNGKPVKGASIRFLRSGYAPVPQIETVAAVVVVKRAIIGAAISFPVSGPGMYHVVTNKKGHYGHFGLPPGRYDMSLEIEGVLVETIYGITINAGDATIHDFDVSGTH